MPRIQYLLDRWKGCTDLEKTRRLVDLFVVSVFLDAGAGSRWNYKAQDGQTYNRSEGLAIASLEMFESGLFSSDEIQPCEVDRDALERLDVDAIGREMQVSPSNPMEGLDGRAKVLRRLGEALGNEKYFGQEGRPGNLIGEKLAAVAVSHFADESDRLPFSSSADTTGSQINRTSADLVGRSCRRLHAHLANDAPKAPWAYFG